MGEGWVVRHTKCCMEKKNSNLHLFMSFKQLSSLQVHFQWCFESLMGCRAPCSAAACSLCAFSVLHCWSANLFCFFFLYIRSADSSPLKKKMPFCKATLHWNIKNMHMKHFCLIFFIYNSYLPTKTMLSSVYLVILLIGSVQDSFLSAPHVVFWSFYSICFVRRILWRQNDRSVAHFTDFKAPSR